MIIDLSSLPQLFFTIGSLNCRVLSRITIYNELRNMMLDLMFVILTGVDFVSCGLYL